MRRIRRFLAWPLAEKWLLCKAWVLLFAVRIALWTVRYNATRRWLRRLNTEPRRRRNAERLPAARVARIVEIASHFVPSGGHCLTRALVAETLLRRRGYTEVEVTIGVAKDDNGQLIAHAWLKSGGTVLIGGEESVNRYTQLNRSPQASRTE